MSTKRIRRPTPARTAPHRTWTPAAPATEQRIDAVPPPRGSGGPRERIEATVSKSVELGYKVIDEYLQQGQRTAERLNAGALTAEAVATEAQDLGTRVARYASDFFGAWMELLELAAAGRAAQPDLRRPATTDSAAAPTATPTPAPPDAAASSRMQLDLATTRAVRIRLDLHPDRIRGTLRVHALRSADPSCGRLDDVTCVLDGDAPLVALRIPPEQRPGAYEGLLIDETTNRPVGSLRVTLTDKRPRPQARPSKTPRASRTSPSSKPSSKRR
jgi:hypothetical protein